MLSKMEVRKRSADTEDACEGSCKRRFDRNAIERGFERTWSLLSEAPAGWDFAELEIDTPNVDSCFAALLHGHKHEYFAFACVRLGQTECSCADLVAVKMWRFASR